MGAQNLSSLRNAIVVQFPGGFAKGVKGFCTGLEVCEMENLRDFRLFGLVHCALACEFEATFWFSRLSFCVTMCL